MSPSMDTSPIQHPLTILWFFIHIYISLHTRVGEGVGVYGRTNIFVYTIAGSSVRLRGKKEEKRIAPCHGKNVHNLILLKADLSFLLCTPSTYLSSPPHLPSEESFLNQGRTVYNKHYERHEDCPHTCRHYYFHFFTIGAMSNCFLRRVCSRSISRGKKGGGADISHYNKNAHIWKHTLLGTGRGPRGFLSSYI